MSLHSRLPVGASLKDRVSAINLLCDKLSQRGAQVERLRWRVAIELYAVQRIVLAKGLAWEEWCETNINRSLRDIRRLIKMAKSHDPEAAHEEEKTAAKKGMARTRQERTNMSAASAKQSAKAARHLISAILSCHSISEVRAMLGLVEMSDLINALDEAEAASTLADAVPVVSTATH